MQFIYNVVGTPLGYVMWACYQLVNLFTDNSAVCYFVALVLFTLLIRLLLYPLAVKQHKNSLAMVKFKPKMEAIQKRYANDKQRLNEEMMKLYQEEHYNPMSGCLPLLIQMPILFGLIDVVYRPLKHILHIPADVIEKAVTITKDTLGVTTGYAEQINVVQAFHAHPDAFSTMGAEFIDKVSGFNLNIFGIDLGETPSLAFNLLLLVPILSGATALIQSLYSMYKTTHSMGQSAGGGMMKGMMIIMPLFSAMIAFQVPAGVGLYWTISNTIYILQTFLLYKIYNPEKILAAARAEEERIKEQERLDREERRRKARERQLEMQQSKGQKGKKKPGNANLPAKAAPEEPVDEAAEKELTQKEINRRLLAEARRRDAEKYGEEYVEVTDEDLNVF